MTSDSSASENSASENSAVPSEGPSLGPDDEMLTRAGLSWSWDLDLEALLNAVGARAEPVPARSGGDPDEPDAADERMEAEFAEYLEAFEAGQTEVIPLPVVCGRIAESLPPGPGLAGWLAASDAADLDEWALPGVAASFRRLAAWAQAGELAAVAHIAARSAAEDAAAMGPVADEAAANGAAASGDAAVGGAAAGDPAAGDPAAGDPAAGDPAAGDPAADDPAAADGAASDAAVGDTSASNLATEEEAATGDDGRPARITADACGQVSLALTLSQAGAAWWTDLAVTLQWRLAATGAALRSGDIDLARARAIADATSVLDEDKARTVQDRVLLKAGYQTLGQLRSALRRAVIAADPEGAEQRRQEAERRAKVTLYPDAEGTASLAGYSLPGVRAAAALARITALARAMKAAGADGGIDLLRSKVFLGLLLGTLPYIPPAPGGPADHDLPPDDGAPEGSAPEGSAPEDSVPEDSVPEDSVPEDSAPEDSVPEDSVPEDSVPEDSVPEDSVPEDSVPEDSVPEDSVPEDSVPEDSVPEDGVLGGSAPEDWVPEDGSPEDCPPEDCPPEYGGPEDCAPEDSDDQATWIRPVVWPHATAFFPPAPGGMANLPPTEGGLLDLRVPWSTLAGDTGEPGYLARLGPITPSQARYLAQLAARDPTVLWRVVVTGSDGRAIAVTRVPAAVVRSWASRAGPSGHRPGEQQATSHGNLIARVTVTVNREDLSPGDLSSGDVRSGGLKSSDRRSGELGSGELGSGELGSGDLGSGELGSGDLGSGELGSGDLGSGDLGSGDPLSGGLGLELLLERILAAAAEAASQAAARAAADSAAPGGCAHTDASPAYRPPQSLREYVSARDLTCRFLTCRQPAARCDLDHTRPYDQDGITCSCNLGPACRFHHRLKQHPRWQLAQPAPGIFTWTTPAGRVYSAEPDSHAA